MFKKIITQKSFWISVFIFAIAFIVLFNLIRIFFEFKFDFAGYFSFYFDSERLPSFIVANLIGGIVYGMLTAYYRFWKHFKTQK